MKLQPPLCPLSCAVARVDLTPDLTVSLTLLAEVRPRLTHLFDLQPVAPDPLQQVTQAGDERVLLQAGDVGLTVAQLHRLSTHLLHQHPLGLENTRAQKNLLQLRSPED